MAASPDAAGAAASRSGDGRASGTRTDIGPVLAIGAVGGLVALLAVRGIGLNALALAPAYLGTLGALFGWLGVRRRRGGDTSLVVLALIAAATIGPVGAIGAALAIWLAGGATTGTLLADWYERISLSVAVDPVTRLCDDVSVGRTIDLGSAAPGSFLAVMETGGLAERQAVLGLIARRFHPDYLPVLRAALASPEPVVRVQAAAVAAHVRGRVGEALRAAIVEVPAAEDDPVVALSVIARLEALVQSGLLDETERQRGAAASLRLGDGVVAGLGAGRGLPRGRTGGVAGVHRATLEKMLIERRRFAELRALRSTTRVLSGRTGARVRRIGGEVRP